MYGNNCAKKDKVDEAQLLPRFEIIFIWDCLLTDGCQQIILLLKKSFLVFQFVS